MATLEKSNNFSDFTPAVRIARLFRSRTKFCDELFTRISRLRKHRSSISFSFLFSFFHSPLRDVKLKKLDQDQDARRSSKFSRIRGLYRLAVTIGTHTRGILESEPACARHRRLMHAYSICFIPLINVNSICNACSQVWLTFLNNESTDFFQRPTFRINFTVTVPSLL